LPTPKLEARGWHFANSNCSISTSTNQGCFQNSVQSPPLNLSSVSVVAVVTSDGVHKYSAEDREELCCALLFMHAAVSQNDKQNAKQKANKQTVEMIPGYNIFVGLETCHHPTILRCYGMLFSAFWLRSSVVSVLIFVTIDISTM
jgi:hypothetical protein